MFRSLTFDMLAVATRQAGTSMELLVQEPDGVKMEFGRCFN